MAIAELSFFIVLCSITTGCCAAEYCRETVYYTSGGSSVRTFRCSFGCCGSHNNEYCCVSNAGIIVGIVFASIFVICMISALVCCVLKKKGARGRTIRPSNGAPASGYNSHQSNVFIVPSAPSPPAYSAVGYATQYSAYPYGAPAYPPMGQGGMPPMPPAYSQSMPPPPAYSYNETGNPAYPPPTAAGTQGAT